MDPRIARREQDSRVRGRGPRLSRRELGAGSGGSQVGRRGLRGVADDRAVDVDSDLPEALGLRATSRGGHIAVQDAVTAQLGSTIRALRSFSRLRRARNSLEYPSTQTPGPSADDAKDAIRVAREVNDAAAKILDSDILSPLAGRSGAGQEISAQTRLILY
jgi:hypothetical protein